MYKVNLALNNLQWLICHKTEPNHQTHLDPSLDTFLAIDLTLSVQSIFIGYNWRVIKGLCSSDHYPILMENIDRKVRTTCNSTPKF